MNDEARIPLVWDSAELFERLRENSEFEVADKRQTELARALACPSWVDAAIDASTFPFSLGVLR